MPGKRIAIIGAGPIGLEAALYARTLGYGAVVFERGVVAAALADWGFMRLFSPWIMNTTSLGRRLVEQTGVRLPLEQYPTGYELREQYLVPISRLPVLAGCVHEHTAVVGVTKDSGAAHPFRLRVQEAGGVERVEEADILLDCSGTYANHRWAGAGGQPAPGERELQDRIFYRIPDVLGRDRHRFADRHTLLIGCNYSSAAVLRNLQDLVANCPRTAVTWAVRRADQAVHPVLNDPLRPRGRLVESLLKMLEHPPGWLRYLTVATLQSISADSRSFKAVFRSNGRIVCLMPDEVVCLSGYQPDNSIYGPMQLQTTYAGSGQEKLKASALSDSGAEGLVTEADVNLALRPEPTFFILGAKSYGANAAFMLQAGHMQILDAFAMIEGKPGLDLYQ